MSLRFGDDRVLAVAPAGDAQVGLERKIVLQQDLQMPGYETVVAEVTLAVGGREGRHTHPGTLMVTSTRRAHA